MGSPLSGLVLYLYTKSIKKFGTKFTLRISFVSCIFILALVAIYARSMKGIIGKIVIVFFYAFREIYVSLLSSQLWAFIAGSLNKSTSSYIVSFSGIVSVASAVGGCCIEQLVAYGGIQTLLSASLLSVVCSALCAEAAYSTLDTLPHTLTAESTHTQEAAEVAYSTLDSSPNTINTADITHTEEASRHYNTNSTPSSQTHQLHTVRKEDSLRKRRTSSVDKDATSLTTTTSAIHTHIHIPAGVHKHIKKTGFWIDSWNLFCAHHTLQILLVEAILHQLCGNMLNIMFHNGLRLEVVDESTRAMLVGRFFASVNITSCTLQCFVLPHILSHSTLPTVLKKIPLLVLAAVCLGIINPGLVSVMLGFGAIKVLEYSILHSASQLIYMPLGQDVRYVGKELVRFFGHKLGKSGSSLILSALISQLNPSLAVQSIWGALFTLSWGVSLFYLAGHISERHREDDRTTVTETTRLVTELNKKPALRK